MRSAAEILREHRIVIESSAEGRYYATCPECSSKRSKQHQKLKCLGVTIDNKGVMFGCNHCDWKGGGSYETPFETPRKANGTKLNGANGQSRPKPDAKREIAETYDYTDEEGVRLFQVVRFGFRRPDGNLVIGKSGKPEKSFGQRRPDPDNPGRWIWGLGAGDYMRRAAGNDWYRFDEDRWAKLPASRERKTVAAGAKCVPYRLPELIEAIAAGHSVLIVEGEQKADLLASWKLAATCNAQGADKWTAAHAKHLSGSSIVILPDNDEKGREHAERVAASLHDIAASIRVLELPDLQPKGDIVDWANAGGTREQLDVLIERAPQWRRASAPTIEPAPQPPQQQQSNATARGLVVHRASDIQIEPVEWLWPGRIALGKQTLVAGEAGLGKSQISNSMAAIVTTASDWPCREGRAPLGSVLFLCAEDGVADTIVPRLMAAGADRNRIHIVTAVQAEDGKGRRAFNLQADLDLLERKIGEIGDVRLIVIDPISSYMGPKVDSHVNAAVRGVLEPIGELAARLRVAIVSITHPPKGTGTAAINRFIGSVAFVAAARSAFMVARDPDDESRRLFLPVKNNLAPLGTGLAFRLEQRLVGPEEKGVVASAVAWEASPVIVSADEALRAADDGNTDEHSAKDDAIDFLHTMLTTGPIKVADIEREARNARLLGENQSLSQSKPFRSARKTLGVITSKGGMDDGWIWSLPKMPS